MKWKGFAIGAGVILAGYLWKGPPDFLTEAPRLPDGRSVRVQVLNGSGVSKAGLRLAQDLRGKGFDVVEIGNATEPAESTIVFDRVGESRWAKAVARRMGVEGTRVETDPDLLVEVTVVLGKDRGERYGRSR